MFLINYKCINIGIVLYFLVVIMKWVETACKTTTTITTTITTTTTTIGPM